MTVALSPQKVSRILRNYFSGMSQCNIANKARVDQSTVSIYASRLRQRAMEIGLLAAGREFGVFNEINALRSLSFELSKNNLTVEEANQGLKIIKAFMKLGVHPERHTALVKLCKEIKDPGFIQAALKLNRIEAEGKASYEEVVSRFEGVSSELPAVENRLDEIQTKLKSISGLVNKKNQELAKVEAHLKQLKKDIVAQQAKLKRDFENKRKELNVKMEEIKEVAKLKADLGKHGFDIPTFLRLAKEYIHGSSKG
jgi:DNA repair exonuclease SbcCD ATPase subunit